MADSGEVPELSFEVRFKGETNPAELPYRMEQFRRFATLQGLELDQLMVGNVEFTRPLTATIEDFIEYGSLWGVVRSQAGKYWHKLARPAYYRALERGHPDYDHQLAAEARELNFDVTFETYEIGDTYRHSNITDLYIPSLAVHTRRAKRRMDRMPLHTPWAAVLGYDVGEGALSFWDNFAHYCVPESRQG